MLTNIMERIDPEILANTFAQACVDRHFSGGTFPLAGEIHTALEQYRARYSHDEATLRAVIADVRHQLAGVLEMKKETILDEIEILDDTLATRRRRVDELNAEIERLNS